MQLPTLSLMPFLGLSQSDLFLARSVELEWSALGVSCKRNVGDVLGRDG